jgi:arylsulfatase A-like enzyme
MAWSAYAVTEFVSTSVLHTVIHRFSVFTPWHWRLTALLVAAYLVTGILTGALAGLAVHVLRRKTRLLSGSGDRVLDAAAAFTVAAAFAINLRANPLGVAGKEVLFWFSIGYAVLLLTSMRSAKWSGRFGFLTSPWVVAGLLLGVGQEFAVAQMQDSAETLGINGWAWSAALAGVLIAFALGAVLLGRLVQRRLPGRFFAPNWAAVGLTVTLLLVSTWSAREVAAQSQDSATLSNNTAKPNVLLVVMDTVRADHLFPDGYPRETTPNLKKLAQDSTVYTQALAPSDMTLASHASLFTGMYPSWHGAHCQPPESSYGRELSKQTPTLAEILSAKGYWTAGVSANMYLRPAFGLQRGFQSFSIPRPLPLLPSESYWYLLRTGMRRALGYVTDTSQFDRLYCRSQDVNSELFRVMRNHPAAPAPFFVFLNYMDAHFPYIPPAPFDGMFSGSHRTIPTEEMDETSAKVVRGEPMTAGEYSYRVSQYDGGIAYVDSNIGQLVDWLKQRKLYDNTLIVVAADHGEAFGEKNLVLHANSVYQNLLHVPLLIKFPNSARTGVVRDPVSLIDVAPTILGALDYSAPANVQGRNLLQAAGAREIFGESFPCPATHRPECGSDGCMERAVFSWPYKLIVSSSGRRESYDLARDPGETKNLYGAQNLVAQGLSGDLSRWMKTAPSEARQQNKVDGDTVRRLKSLGYVQ